MKHSVRILSLLAIAAVTLFFASCDKGDDDKPDETAAQIEKLTGTWKATSVTLDGDTFEGYEDFTLTLQGGANNTLRYTASGRPVGSSPWGPNGTFAFGNPVTSNLLRDDDVTVEYNLSGSNLQLSIDNYSGEGYPVAGRVESISGDWVFNLVKQ